MSDFALSRESCEERLDFAVAVSEFENGVEQRRLKHANSLIGFKIKSPVLTKTQMQAYRSFIVGKYGALTSFTFTSPYDDTEYDVRFVPGSFRTIYEAGIFRCEFEFEKLND